MEINDLPGIDRAYWKGRSLIKNGLSVWIWGGLVVNIALLIFNTPWGPGLGIANSPQRDTWRAIGTFFGSLPVAFWLMTYWIDHQEWVAEANGEEYEVGKYYPVVTTKRIITSDVPGLVLLGTLVHRLGSRYTFGARYMTADPAWWAGTFTNWINPWNHIQFMGIKFIGVYIGAALGRYVWMKKPEYKILE
jgi:hypothetical protein